MKFAGITGTVAGGLLGISKGIDGRLVFSFETLISRINWLVGIGKAKIKTFWESLTNIKIPIVEEMKESSFWKKFSFDNKKENVIKKLELPKIESIHSEVNRTQNNNFTINIQTDKKDMAEIILQKVMNRVSEFSKTFLYDPVPEVL